MNYDASRTHGQLETDESLGAWLMHCHIAWHIGEGLGMQFVEEAGQAVLPDSASFEKTCNNWKAYVSGSAFIMDDSGL